MSQICIGRVWLGTHIHCTARCLYRSCGSIWSIRVRMGRACGSRSDRRHLSDQPARQGNYPEAESKKLRNRKRRCTS